MAIPCPGCSNPVTRACATWLCVTWLGCRQTTLNWLRRKRPPTRKVRLPHILAEMHPKGYWVKPGPGYNPKYFSIVWSLTALAQLGASTKLDMRISQACAYLLEKNLTPHGQFSHNGAPSGTIDCLQGNLCAALVALGCDDPRLAIAFEWMARTVTGEGIAPAEDREAPLRYYAYKCGPVFACGANGRKPCAWGAAKVMLAFSLWPVERRTPLIERAIQQGVDFLFSTDPARADYPTRTDSQTQPELVEVRLPGLLRHRYPADRGIPGGTWICQRSSIGKCPAAHPRKAG